MKRTNNQRNKSSLHKMPADLQKALATNSKARAVWEDITPIARSDWICWIISGKLAETRKIRIEKALSMLSHGKRRVCCFAGCVHR